MTTLTKREQFALAAMQGMLANHEFQRESLKEAGDIGVTASNFVAVAAYIVADAMLAESVRTAQPEPAAHMDGEMWINYSGGPTFFPIGAQLMIRRRDGEELHYPAADVDWTQDNSGWNVIAYRVVPS